MTTAEITEMPTVTIKGAGIGIGRGDKLLDIGGLWDV
jgi:hypothetical protein